MLMRVCVLLAELPMNDLTVRSVLVFGFHAIKAQKDSKPP